MPDVFVPSTEDVRECYAAIGSGPSYEEREKEFDRWESQHALNIDLRRFSNRHLRQLADQAERIIQERNDDGVME